jgi:hypothetical protein
MTIRFTVRSLLGMTTAVAVLLSLSHMSDLIESRRDTENAIFFVDVVRRLYMVAFWLTLLMPFWFPLLFLSADSRKELRLRPFLALVPCAWYFALICLYHLMRQGVVISLLGKPVAVCGTVVAMVAMARAGHRSWYILAGPLVIATLAGTVWCVVSSP